jgi:AcrR family transcriptional regulator
MALISTEDLLDSQQVADVLGLTHRNSVTTYTSRHPDFPVPIVTRGNGRIRLWARDDILAWKDTAARRRSPAQERADARTGPAPDANAQQRQRIVDAARRLMLTVPPGDLSIRRIALEAGLPHPVLYRHVQTKSQIFELVVEDAIGQISQSMAGLAVESWRSYVPGVVHEMLAQSASVRLFVLWLIENGDRESTPTAAVLPQLMAALAADPRARGSGVIATREAAAGVAALLVGAIVFHQRISELLGPDALSEELLTCLCTAICELSLS